MADLQLAHDLSKDVWRSEDIAFGAHQSGQVEIITPELKVSKSTAEASKSNYHLLKSANSTFSSIKINASIVEDLKRCGFVRPSPIQATSIPLGRIGIDLIAQSKSGTGKTIVFVVCALEMVIEALHEPPAPRVLIVAPTREIAVQIGAIIDSLTSSSSSTWSNFSCYKAIGGTKVSENIAQLATSQIIVGTPGRICCLLEMDFLKPNSIRLLVLDECDKLMEESFKRQIDKLYGYLPTSKQMIVTSATMSDEMTLFLANYMRNPALVRLNADNPALVGVIQMYHRTEGHSLDYLNFEAKIEPLLAILREISFSQCVIFSNFQTRAKYLFDRLVASKWTVMHISGDMTQKERLEAISAFRRHKCRILVSTDLTSRGIDIDTVNLIINLDVPIDSETYLHRIGRAGRFGSAGIAITLVGSDTDVGKFRNILEEYRLQVEELTLPIKVNPWNSFYQDRLDRSQSLLQKSWSEGLQVNKLFAELVASISQPDDDCTDDHGDNCQFDFEIASDEPLCSSNSNANQRRTFLNSLFTSQVSELCIAPSMKGEEEEEDEELLDTGSDSQSDSESAENIYSEELFEENFHVASHLSEVDDETVQQQQTDVRQDQQCAEALKGGNDGASQRLFKQAFLRPPTSVLRGGVHFPSLMPSNVAICKYLLRGGSPPGNR